MKTLSSLSLIIIMSVMACKSPQKDADVILESIAQSDKQWTGIAVSQTGRVFVNYPNWSSNVPVSVAEIENGMPRSYPNMEWNLRRDTLSFNAVQSVFIDSSDRLWILDTNNPRFKGVNPQGPMLYQFDLSADTLAAVFNFTKECFKDNSYFNDVRIDTRRNVAYMTDSGDGAIIVLDLNTRQARRLLDDHASTESETDHLFCDGNKWENSVHSDGIALTPNAEYLYYVALTGHTLYRIPTKDLLNENLTAEELEASVEKVEKIPATDGMLFDDDGNLYLGGLEDNSINRLNVDGSLEKLIQDPTIRWADSFAKDSQGHIYFTTSQIHLPENKRMEYDVFRYTPKKKSQD